MLFGRSLQGINGEAVPSHQLLVLSSRSRSSNSIERLTTNDQKLPLRLQAEGGEVGVVVVVILVFGPFKELYDLVSDRRVHDLPGTFQQVIRDDDLADLVCRPNTVKGERVKNEGVNRLSRHRGADRSRPEVFAFGQNLHFRQNERVRKLPGEEGNDRGEGDPSCGAESDSVSFLIGPIGSRRQVDDHPAHERRVAQSSESRPHHLACPRVPVDLRQDVSEDVAQWEKEDACAERETPDRDDLRRPDDVRAEKNRDECGHHEVVVLVGALLQAGEA